MKNKIEQDNILGELSSDIKRHIVDFKEYIGGYFIVIENDEDNEIIKRIKKITNFNSYRTLYAKGKRKIISFIYETHTSHEKLYPVFSIKREDWEEHTRINGSDLRDWRCFGDSGEKFEKLIIKHFNNEDEQSDSQVKRYRLKKDYINAIKKYCGSIEDDVNKFVKKYGEDYIFIEQEWDSLNPHWNFVFNKQSSTLLLWKVVEETTQNNQTNISEQTYVLDLKGEKYALELDDNTDKAMAELKKIQPFTKKDWNRIFINKYSRTASIREAISVRVIKEYIEEVNETQELVSPEEQLYRVTKKHNTNYELTLVEHFERETFTEKEYIVWFKGLDGIVAGSYDEDIKEEIEYGYIEEVENQCELNIKIFEEQIKALNGFNNQEIDRNMIINKIPEYMLENGGHYLGADAYAHSSISQLRNLNEMNMSVAHPYFNYNNEQTPTRKESEKMKIEQIEEKINKKYIKKEITIKSKLDKKTGGIDNWKSKQKTILIKRRKEEKFGKIVEARERISKEFKTVSAELKELKALPKYKKTSSHKELIRKHKRYIRKLSKKYKNNKLEKLNNKVKITIK